MHQSFVFSLQIHDTVSVVSPLSPCMNLSWELEFYIKLEIETFIFISSHSVDT